MPVSHVLGCVIIRVLCCLVQWLAPKPLLMKTCKQKADSVAPRPPLLTCSFQSSCWPFWVQPLRRHSGVLLRVPSWAVSSLLTRSTLSLAVSLSAAWWQLADLPETFDIRVEVQAPVNGTEAYNNGVPNEAFSLKIGGEGAELIDVTKFFSIEDPKRASQVLPTLLTCSREAQLWLLCRPLRRSCQEEDPRQCRLQVLPQHPASQPRHLQGRPHL